MLEIFHEIKWSCHCISYASSSQTCWCALWTHRSATRPQLSGSLGQDCVKSCTILALSWPGNLGRPCCSPMSVPQLIVWEPLFYALESCFIHLSGINYSEKYILSSFPNTVIYEMAMRLLRGKKLLSRNWTICINTTSNCTIFLYFSLFKCVWSSAYYNKQWPIECTASWKCINRSAM